MASSLGVEFEGELTMNFFPELTPNPNPPPSEPEEGNLASGTTAEPPLTTRQTENAPNTNTEGETETTRVNCLLLPLNSGGVAIPEEKPSAIPVITVEDEEMQSTFKSDELDFNSVDIPEPNEMPEQPLLPLEMQAILGIKRFGARIRVHLIVSKVVIDYDGTQTLSHAGDITINVFPYTTLRNVKAKLIQILFVFYEDMALVYKGKFLRDGGTLEYYHIENEHIMHLLVEKPSPLFREVFISFKALGMQEEKAWFATRSYIKIAYHKEHETEDSNEEIVMKGFDQLYIPDTDESDVVSADEDEPDDYLY